VSEAMYHRYRCALCNRIHYRNPKVGAALLIAEQDRILLVRRSAEPFRGWWTLPSGYVEYEETCEECAVREAEEEIGTGVELSGLHGVYSYTDDPRSHMVLVVYRARAQSNDLVAGDDADAVGWFPTNALPEQIAFSGIRKAIQDYVEG